MTLPHPSLPRRGPVDSDEILCHYPAFIEFLGNSVRSLHYKPYLQLDLHSVKALRNRDALYRHHLRLYEQYVAALLQLYERHCPGVPTVLALVCMGEDLYHLLGSQPEDWPGELCFTLCPIVHPQRWDPDGPKLTQITMPYTLLDSGVHPLLSSILAPWVPRICLETTLSFLRYLQSGGHPVKTRNSLKPLVKASYFKGLKMRPWLSRLRRRRYCRLSGDRMLGKRGLRSTWWGNSPLRPENDDSTPLRFFTHRTECASNYDLWYTYRYALQLLPTFLAKAPVDPQIALVAATHVFNLFCTAHPRETRKAKKAIAGYLSRRRPIKAVPRFTVGVGHGMGNMDVDSD